MQGGLNEIERAFTQKFSPDSYELLNVYKLYDDSLEVEDHKVETRPEEAAAENQQNSSTVAAEALGEQISGDGE